MGPGGRSGTRRKHRLGFPLATKDRRLFPPKEAGRIFPALATETPAPHDSKRSAPAPGPWEHSAGSTTLFSKSRSVRASNRWIPFRPAASPDLVVVIEKQLARVGDAVVGIDRALAHGDDAGAAPGFRPVVVDQFGGCRSVDVRQADQGRGRLDTVLCGEAGLSAMVGAARRRWSRCRSTGHTAPPPRCPGS